MTTNALEAWIICRKGPNSHGGTSVHRSWAGTKKNWNFVQNAPLGGPDPHFGTPNMKSAWTPIFLAGHLLKFDIGVPEIDFSWDLRGVFPFRPLMAFGRWAVRVYFISGRLDQSNEYWGINLWGSKFPFFHADSGIGLKHNFEAVFEANLRLFYIFKSLFEGVPDHRLSSNFTWLDLFTPRFLWACFWGQNWDSQKD